jgi:hypothetical protein
VAVVKKLLSKGADLEAKAADIKDAATDFYNDDEVRITHPYCSQQKVN